MRNEIRTKNRRIGKKYIHIVNIKQVNFLEDGFCGLTSLQTMRSRANFFLVNYSLVISGTL